MLRTAYVFDAGTVAFLHSGCALLIGTVDDGGRPHAGRAWGLRVLDGDRPMVRLLVDAEDEVTLANLAAGGAVAVTGADVRSLRSLQLKGTAIGVEPLDPADAEVAADYAEAFYTDVVEGDGTDRSLVERLTPVGYVPCTIEVLEAFDQTPGPSAGQPLPGPTP